MFIANCLRIREKRILGTFYIPLVKNFFNRCYYSLLRCHPGDWAHLTTRYFEGSASFSSFDKLRTSFSANSQPDRYVYPTSGEENPAPPSIIPYPGF
jgi:hypothetical protein